MRRRNGIVVAGVCGALLVWALPLTADGSAARDRWRITATQDPSPQGNYLTAIERLGAHDVWSVGAWYRPDLSTPGTLTEHWNGKAWKIVPSPNATDGYNELYDVSGTASDDVWAVGYDNIAAYGTERTLALHWNGRRWRIVPTPNLGSSANELESVHAFAPDDVWAVGFGDDPGGFAGRAIAVHWDGSDWQLHDLAPKGAEGSELEAVGGTSPEDVWAVGSRDGSTLVEHFDGQQWSIVPSPDGAGENELLGVTAIAPDDVWAVGASESGLSQSGGTLVLHWDGDAWSVVRSPNGSNPESVLLDVYAFGTDDVWAAGLSYDDLHVTSQTLLEHWNGTRWRILSTPNPDPEYNELDGLTGFGSSRLWLVGARGSRTLAMHD